MKTLEAFWRWAIHEKPQSIGEKQLKTLSPLALRAFTTAAELIDDRAGCTGLPHDKADRRPFHGACMTLSLAIGKALVEMHEQVEKDCLKPPPKPRPAPEDRRPAPEDRRRQWYIPPGEMGEGTGPGPVGVRSLLAPEDRQRLRTATQKRLDELRALTTQKRLDGSGPLAAEFLATRFTGETKPRCLACGSDYLGLRSCLSCGHETAPLSGPAAP